MPIGTATGDVNGCVWQVFCKPTLILGRCTWSCEVSNYRELTISNNEPTRLGSKHSIGLAG